MILIAVILVGLFAGTVLLGAPYVPTRQKDIETALDLLDLQPGQTLVELGSGDGRLLAAAGKRDLRAVGYEVNPLLALVSVVRTWRLRNLIKIHLANYKLARWPDHIDGLYIFGSKREMRFIAKKIAALPKPITLVSYGFKLPGHEATNAVGPFYSYQIDK